MTVSYEIILTIINLTNHRTQTFNKEFNFNLDKSDDKLYNNHHLIAENAQMFSLFKSEIDDYCQSHDLTINNIDIEEFDINSLTDKVDLYFESDEEEYSNQITLEPNIICYVYPKYDSLEPPVLNGEAYDSNTIVWSWEEDGYSHYLISEVIDVNNEDEKDKIIAQLPINKTSYIETGLEADTRYTRRLVSYDTNQTSRPSAPATVQTAIAPVDKSLDQYKINKNYDYTSDDKEREPIRENLEAFHSGVGDFNDLKVYKQMDADFYQQFKAYIQLRGSRTQREKRYDTVGFNYKVCLESIETVEEQKGEVTFDIDVYPIEKISIEDYMYATQPVDIHWSLQCDVLLRKKTPNSQPIDVPIQEPLWKPKLIEVPNNEVTIPPKLLLSPAHVIFVLDKTTSSYNLYADDEIWYCDDSIEGLMKDRGIVGGFIDGAITPCIVQYILDIDSVAQQCGQPAYFSIVTFNNDASIDREHVSANEAIAFLAGGIDQSHPTCTNWNSALDAANTLAERYSEPIAVFFYSDGGANTYETKIIEGHADWDGSFLAAEKYAYLGVDDNITNTGTWKIKDKIRESADRLKNHPHVNIIYACVYSSWSPVQGGAEHQSGNPRQRFGENYVLACARLIGREGVTGWITPDDIDNALNLFTNQIVQHGAHYYTHPRTGQLEAGPTHLEAGGYTFEGWHDVTDGRRESVNVQWDIDEFKWARVNIGPFTFQMHDGLTPIVYDRSQKRAVIPPDSIIIDTNFDQSGTPRQSAVQLSSTPLDVMIYNAVQNTTLWQNGYNTMVSAQTNDEKSKGFYIIRGLLITDTYGYADEDSVPDVDFTDGNDRSEPGYVGSLNVYTHLEKMNTLIYGDDLYIVPSSGGVPSTPPGASSSANYGASLPLSDPSHYVWLSGYTDAIIYDGNRIESFELNASCQEQGHNDPRDHQTQILTSPVANYNSFLWNRKKASIGYTGNSSDITHVVEIIAKDKDIYLTGNDASTNLVAVGDWSVFLPSNKTYTQPSDVVRGVTYPVIDYHNDDVVAHNDEHYGSPILNYRFNMEDPDAYTSYYEILPDCDPLSPYKNIVFLHIYYARNIYIQNEEGTDEKTAYIESFGKSNIATKSSAFYENNTEILGQTYFRDDYIDDYLWFMAKEMLETRPYYDEKPNPGMDTFYGNVNGRYRKNNRSGKQDLRVVTPQFNLPTTIDANNIKIYIVITEFSPDTALVAYKWEHPSAEKDSITNTNGDYVTFSSDSLTYKDVVYNDLIKTITSNPIELFDNKNVLETFKISKPTTVHEYDKYYVELYTDNSDVVILNYPSEVIFDELGNTEFGATFKGVVNATTKWSPRIHNGYYYLNQHEYYAYSEFNVEADFEEYNEENYKSVNGYVTIDVDLFRKAGDPEHYDIVKNTRSELIQDEKNFTWIDGKGLTVTPVIDGEYYKQYTARRYTSPVILFNNVLTSAGKLNVDYYFEDGSDFLPMMVRSYNIETGAWSDWVDFENGTVPNCPLSCAYQLSFDMNASVINKDKTIEDYLCCYLDWKDESEPNCLTNCVTITDHLQAGPDEADAIFNSKIIDFGCETTISIDMFCSHYDPDKECVLYIATEDYNKDRLLLENINWSKVDGTATVTAKYFRYRVVIPYGEKVYWIHKNITTKESEVYLPILEQIQMTGDFVPEDTYDSFQEIQGFSVTTDGLSHKVFDSVYDIISGDIVAKGFNNNEIKNVTIKSTESNIEVSHSAEIDVDFPSVSALSTPIYATADLEIETSIKNTPYIYATVDPVKSLDVLEITKGTPQQYCPITMEDSNGISYKEVFDVDPITMKKTEIFMISSEDDTHYIKLSRNDFDIDTFEILLNETVFEDYSITNNLVIFNNLLEIGDELKISYNILNSFYTETDYENNTTQMTIYSDYESELAKQAEISALEPILGNRIYTECNLRQIYSNGTKQVVRSGAITRDPYWRYSNEDNILYYTQNNENFSMIINNLISVTTYELVVRAYSTNEDNDVIGIVMGHIRDVSGMTHTLSYLVSLSDTYTFNDDNTAIVLDYNRDHPQILASETVSCPYTNWNEMENGIKFYVKKANGSIQCKISNWNESSWNDNSLLEIQTTGELSKFNEAVKYGFCVRSQKDTYFVEPEFAGIVDKTITVEDQIRTLKHKYKVYFETNERNNKFIANKLSMNPVYRTDYKGFIYLTDEHNEPYAINIYRNPEYIKAGGYDKIDIAIECLDYQENPVISKEIEVDCSYGILNFDDNNAKHLTDMNGVIHIIYESAPMVCTDTIIAKTITSDGEVIQSSVNIINE